MDSRISSDLIRGHTDTIVLALLRRNDSYGYEIYKSIIEKSGGEFELKEATLYSSFKRLEGDSFISSYWGDETQGGRRRYYKITDKGNELYELNKTNWIYAKTMIDKLISE